MHHLVVRHNIQSRHEAVQRPDPVSLPVHQAGVQLAADLQVVPIPQVHHQDHQDHQVLQDHLDHQDHLALQVLPQEEDKVTISDNIINSSF